MAPTNSTIDIEQIGQVVNPIFLNLPSAQEFRMRAALSSCPVLPSSYHNPHHGTGSRQRMKSRAQAETRFATIAIATGNSLARFSPISTPFTYKMLGVIKVGRTSA